MRARFRESPRPGWDPLKIVFNCNGQWLAVIRGHYRVASGERARGATHQPQSTSREREGRVGEGGHPCGHLLRLVPLRARERGTPRIFHGDCYGSAAAAAAAAAAPPIIRTANGTKASRNLPAIAYIPLRRTGEAISGTSRVPRENVFLDPPVSFALSCTMSLRVSLRANTFKSILAGEE